MATQMFEAAQNKGVYDKNLGSLKLKSPEDLHRDKSIFTSTKQKKTADLK